MVHELARGGSMTAWCIDGLWLDVAYNGLQDVPWTWAAGADSIPEDQRIPEQTARERALMADMPHRMRQERLMREMWFQERGFQRVAPLPQYRAVAQ